MPYFHINDFKYGMNRTRKRTVGVPGTLWLLENAVLSRGGDINRAKDFVATYSLPAGDTQGMYMLKGQIYVFGAGTTPGAQPTGVQYQQLAAPGTPSLTAILDVKSFDGKLFVIAEYDDGSVYVFYDGARVTDWDTIADSNSSFPAVSSRLSGKANAEDGIKAQAFGATIQLSAEVPGTAFTITSSTTDASVSEVRATGTITITGGTLSAGVNKISAVSIKGAQVISAAVDWNTSHNQTATDLAAQITTDAINGYSAAATGPVVTITALAGTGSEPNGDAIIVTGEGDVTATDTDMADGVTAAASTSPTAAVTTPTANVAEVAETVATGSVEITGGSNDAGVNYVAGVTVDGVQLLSVPVDFVLSNEATASALAVEINNNTGTSGYAASEASGVVTISASAGTGTTPNTDVVTTTIAGDVTKTDANMSGGVAYVAPVSQISQIVISGSSFDAQDTWAIVVNGTTYKTTGRAAGMCETVFVFKDRVFVTANSLWYFSKLNNAAEWSETDTVADAGFINMSSDTEGNQDLVVASEYSTRAAIFAVDSVRVYIVDQDSSLIEIFQSLSNTGTRAPKSVQGYGSNDVYYLGASGVRSIRSRDGYDAAFVSDVGNAIDEYITKEILPVLTDKQIYDARSLVDSEGRYWLSLGSRIVVLSYFPGSKITGWSTIDFGAAVDEMQRFGSEIWVRSGDTIYLYGGTTGQTYPAADERIVKAFTPFMSASDPAGIKILNGFDAVCENAWTCDVLVDPNDTTKKVSAGNIAGTTYNNGSINLPGRTALVAFEFTCSAAGDASFSQVVIHYDAEEKR